jgi:uncharacterized protein (TIGR01777 family)
MTIALYILAFQTILGALDNVLHHELTERLPSKPSARFELALHSAREGIYGVLFLIFAWTDPQGVFAMAVIALLIAEVIITITDFVEEDRTRNLPPFERVLHTILAVSFGLFLAFAVPHLIANASAPTALVAASHSLLSWFFTLAAIGVLAFSVRDGVAVVTLGRMSAARDVPTVASSGRTVLVTGATGFIGSALVKRLLARGDRVFALARDKRQARALLGDHIHTIDGFNALPPETRIDAVVNLAGAPILGLPWTRSRRTQIWRSRIDLTNALVEWLTTLEQKPAVLVSASAIGFYGEGHENVLHETAGAGQGFAADLCRAWESAAQRAAALDIRVICLRIGIVFDKSGGALPMMALPARFGLGAIFGHGRQWMSWITRDDLIRMILSAVDDKRWNGPINAVAPEPLRHADFQRTLARTFHRPLFLAAPAWALKTMMGEMSTIFLFSQRVLPTRATELGFGFDVGYAADALHLQFGPPPAALPHIAARPTEKPKSVQIAEPAQPARETHVAVPAERERKRAGR